MSKQEPATSDPQYNWTPGADPKTEKEIETFFHSPEIEQLKKLMCEIGRRMWQRNYVDGNGGNLTIRVGDDVILCTPTLISKGFMQPEDICLVDMEGRQLAGTRVRTSEVLTHLGIMKRQRNAKACCHAHPPHTTSPRAARTAILVGRSFLPSALNQRLAAWRHSRRRILIPTRRGRDAGRIRPLRVGSPLHPQPKGSQWESHNPVR